VRTSDLGSVLVLTLLLAFSDGGRTGAACTEDADCDDTAFCNGTELCVDGGCVPGIPPSIDDGIECTEDRCDEIRARISHTPLDHLCSDGLFCNGIERCQPLLGCRPGNPFPIEDGIDCTLDRCDEVNDVILHNPIDVLCHDGNECTLDVCDPTRGCQASPVEGFCDDRKTCTSDDRCVEGVCVGVASTCGDGEIRKDCAEECDDGNEWNWDGCDSLCRYEGLPRLAFGLPPLLEELEDAARDQTLGPEERRRLDRALRHVAKAHWWIVRPDPVMYRVAPSLAQLSLALLYLQGLEVDGHHLRSLTARMLALPRTIVLHRISSVDCANARCERYVSRARKRVRRGLQLERQGKVATAADRYKDAWARLDHEP
jgi:cysteine-rich repeat protein